MTLVDHRLYGLVDDDNLAGMDLPALARLSAQNGVTLIQYRAKRATTAAMIETARAIHAALEGTGVPLLINDRVDVALAAGAEGVHVGEDDMHPDDARRLLGPRAIIGLTVASEADADKAAETPIDYATIGGIFATTSKHNKRPPVGTDGLSALASRIRAARPGLVVGAIAGIDEGNAASVIAAGAGGVAVISSLYKAPDVAGAARRLRAVVDEALARRTP